MRRSKSEFEPASAFSDHKILHACYKISLRWMPSEIWTSAAPKVTQLLWMPWSTCVPKSTRWPKVCRGHDGPCAACVLEADGFKPDMAPAEGFKPDERVYAYRIVSGVRAQPYRGVGQKTAANHLWPHEEEAAVAPVDARSEHGQAGGKFALCSQEQQQERQQEQQHQHQHQQLAHRRGGWPLRRLPSRPQDI